MADLSDEQLIGLMKAGNKAAVVEIDRRYGAELRLFCLRMVYNEALAEDLVQDVLLTCCKLESGRLPTGSLRGWLYQVARNRVIDELRRKKPRERLPQTVSQLWSESAVPIDPVTTPAGRAIKEDRVRRVQTAVESMEDELREVVILYFFQGLSREEVAEVIGLTLSGTKARLARAAHVLREKLQSLNDFSI